MPHVFLLGRFLFLVQYSIFIMVIARPTGRSNLLLFYQRMTKQLSVAHEPVNKCLDSLDQAEVTQDIGYYRNNNTDSNGADDLG